jgi:hypothetical protein
MGIHFISPAIADQPMDERFLEGDLHQALVSVYDEIMWLSRRPNVTPSRARAWYTHVMSESVKRRVRRFTGMVSTEALQSTGEQLMLEHFLRIQTTLSELVARHMKDQIHDVSEFLTILSACERVHIVTRSENYAAMRAKGDYGKANIELVSWVNIPEKQREFLWAKMLRGKVANAGDFSSETQLS